MKNFLKQNIFLIAIISIGIVLIFFPYNQLNGLKFFEYYMLNITKYNELGDFVGGITAPLLSLVAIVLLYMTYKSQKEELFQNRQILTKQTETLNKQQFETTFFNLLNLHHQIVNNIDLVKKVRIKYPNKGDDGDGNKTTEHGRDCFRTFYDGFKTNYNNADKYDDYNMMIKESYLKFYKLHQSDLGHYFRNLYHIFKLISKSNVINKKEYASIVRAQLSSHELLMLFYNGLSDVGVKFKVLIEEFQTLKNMPFDELIISQHKRLYNSEAFLKND